MMLVSQKQHMHRDAAGRDSVGGGAPIFNISLLLAIKNKYLEGSILQLYRLL